MNPLTWVDQAKHRPRRPRRPRLGGRALPRRNLRSFVPPGGRGVRPYVNLSRAAVPAALQDWKFRVPERTRAVRITLLQNYAQPRKPLEIFKFGSLAITMHAEYPERQASLEDYGYRPNFRRG